MRMQRGSFLRAAVALVMTILPASDVFAAVSKCDAAITKAAGKKASCKATVHANAYAKDTSPDAVKLAKCETKFEAACAKGKDKADCIVQTQPCAVVEDNVDACVADVIENPCSNEGGSCWLLGAAGDSCTETCAAEDMVYDAATETYAGSGGTDENCGAVLDSLGVPPGAVQSLLCMSEIGCYFDADNGRFRCTNPGTEGDAFVDGQRTCACMPAP